MPLRPLAGLLFVTLAACAGHSTAIPTGTPVDPTDTDGDGLPDDIELGIGTDPADPDTDDDGLLDGEEAEHGADPLLADTDDDGYTDRDEVHEGHDPADPSDRIYIGNWPYVHDKSGIEPTTHPTRQVGETFLRLQLVDQHGEVVDLYDFYNEDKPVVIDISGEWCPSCTTISAWISGGEDTVGWGTLWPGGPAAVRRKSVYWLTLISEDLAHEAPDPESAARWAEAYPSERIPVLADIDQTALEYADIAYWPTLLLLEPDLTLSQVDDLATDDFGPVLHELDRRFP
jgi:thiol-disulfide isomerase/thioredoxin